MAIGKSETAAARIFRKHKLTPFVNILTPDLFPDKPSGRWRKTMILIPEVVFWLMAAVALGETAMAGAVISFWAPLRALHPSLPIEPVTEEAFCTARKLLPIAFFRRLFHNLVARFDARFAGQFRWNGFRLLGIDGMNTNLAPCQALRDLYPGSSNQHGPARPQGRLVGLVDLWTGLCRAFRFVPLRYSEQRCAAILLKLLRLGDLLLADRNFPGLRLMLAVLTAHAQFLIRLPKNRYHKLPRRRTPSGRRNEWYVTIPLPKALRMAFPLFANGLTLRIIKYQKRGFRPAWLITSLLDTQAYPYEELVTLYHERWRQETRHREWKYTLQINNLRSKSNAGIVKELLVQLTLNNAVRWIMADACRLDPLGQLRPVDLQFDDTKRLVLSQVPAMTVADPRWLARLYRQLLEAILRKKIRVRPGRSYPRKFDHRHRPKGHGKTAPPARLVKKSRKHYDLV